MRWRAIFHRKQWDRERSREIQSYLQIETDENIERGLPPEKARYAARRKLGNPTLIREEVYIMNSIGFCETMAQDLRYAVRMLRRNPAFNALAVLSLALGIGGNAAMFSLVNGVLIRPLPYPDPGRLVRITGYYPQGALAALQQQSRTMDAAGFTTDAEFNLTGHGEAMRLAGSSVSSNLFVVLQAGPELGRVFRPGEDRPGQDAVVLLGHALWQRRFGGDPAIIGRVIEVDGVNREVVGVMPTRFEFPSPQVQLWVPLHMDPRNSFDTWHTGFNPIVGRLRPGATMEQARNELHPLISGIIHLFPYPMASNWNSDATVLPLQQDLTSDFRTRLIVLQCAVGLVLLIACANVAGLLLSRATSRQKEMALRAALGAGRVRIIRQLLTESVVLALAGAGLGLGFAVTTLADFTRLLPPDAAGAPQVQLDWRVATLMAAVALLTGIAFGLAPALSASKPDLVSSVKSGGQRSAAAAGVRVRSALIAGEVALAAVLAISAGLLIKSLWNLTQVNPGFAAGAVLTVRVSPNASFCRERTACGALYNELLQRTQEITGVSDVAAANTLPLSGDTPAIPAELEGHRTVTGEGLAPMLWAGAVTPDYFRILDIPLLEGRHFTEADTEKSAPVVLVSAATARQYWPGQNPIGKHVRTVWSSNDPWRTVVGVVGDVRQYDLAGGSPNWLAGAVYMPYPQAVGIDGKLPTSMTLLVRTGSEAGAAAGRIREIVRNFNPDVPESEIRTMEQAVSGSLDQPRSMMWLFASFAAAALLLAAIGAYGVVSYTTSQRTFEIGVRMALGATRRSIFSLVLGQSFRLVLTGLAVGIAAALAVTRMLSTFLYGIKATDPLTFLAVAALLLAIALLAGYVPARRAASVDPLRALRVD